MQSVLGIALLREALADKRSGLYKNKISDRGPAMVRGERGEYRVSGSLSGRFICVYTFANSGKLFCSY